MDSESKNYEFAYVLSPAVAEDAVLAETAKLSALIEEAKGMVRRVETPKKRRLSYPIKKQGTGYFGWITFSAVPAVINGLDKKTKEISEVLRHLVVDHIRTFCLDRYGTERGDGGGADEGLTAHIFHADDTGRDSVLHVKLIKEHIFQKGQPSEIQVWQR